MKIILWTYKLVPINKECSLEEFEDKMNKMGDKGWELCDVPHLNKVNSQKPFLIFKKPKELTDEQK